MIASFQNVANAMRQCVNIIEDYARASPSSVTQGREAMAQAQANMAQFELSIDPALSGDHTQLGAQVDTTKDQEPKVKAKRVKKPKDPAAPTKPPSTYLIFQNHLRDTIRREHPELQYSEVLSTISERWRNITPEEKKVSQRRLWIRVGLIGSFTPKSTTGRMQNSWSPTRRTRTSDSRNWTAPL